MEDFGEYVVDGMRFADGTPPETMHNRYPLLYHRAGRAAADACADRQPGMSPFFYVRAGADGAGAATQGVFPGDETTDFGQGSGLPSVVPAMLNLALGGVPAFTTDVGGYFDFVAPRTTPELLTRWAQLAAFTPIMRLHNSTSHGEAYPWSFDDATLDAYRRYARAKVRLTGVVAAGLRRAATEGTIGPVRPLMLDDPSPAARSVDDEWLLGEDLLVAPVLTEGARARDVLLPAGARWQRVTVGAAGGFVAQGEPEAGGRTVRVPAPLADIPLFERVTSATPAPATAVRVCASRRRFAIRLPAGLRAARVSVGGRRVGTRRVGGRLRAIVDLRGRPRTGVVVIVTGRARGRAVRQVRRYLTCRPRPARG